MKYNNEPQVEILADTVSRHGKRITTFKLRYWRFIHSELMTHRVFSRNASSSRAIPAKKMLERVWNDPAIPVYWGSNKPGMQAGASLEALALKAAQFFWVMASKLAVLMSWCLMKTGLHKQIANRVTEPFQWIDVIVTATEWDNFFRLRTDAKAQPEFRVLALKMQKTMQESKPILSGAHVPWANEEVADRLLFSFKCGLENFDIFNDDLIISAIARCARVSYMNHFGTNSIEKDRSLFDMLLQDQHMSPFEHVAIALDDPEQVVANFVGWRSYRSYVDAHNKQLTSTSTHANSIW